MSKEIDIEFVQDWPTSLTKKKEEKKLLTKQ